MRTVYEFSVKDRKGKDVSLKEYANEVLLIVNTATKCGFTPQYEELEKLFGKEVHEAAKTLRAEMKKRKETGVSELMDLLIAYKHMICSDWTISTTLMLPKQKDLHLQNRLMSVM